MSWRVDIRLTLGAFDLAVDLDVEAGPITLIGPNGSGKTTLLRTIAGAHRPTAGRVKLGERLIYDAEAGVDLPPEERKVGYVPQGFGLFPHLSALDNVAFAWASRATREERRAQAMKLLEQMDAAPLAHRAPMTLSGGEKQRVALARALMIEPEILLLDEPLSALDAAARRSVRGYLVERLTESGRPAILVTHDARDALALDAPVYVIEGGKVVQHGSCSALAAAPATEFVAEFFDVPSPTKPPAPTS